jgi:phosphoserine phosphatase
LNHGVVFVSDSLPEILTHIAKTLRVDNFLCTKLEKNNGTFSGNIMDRQMIGQQKADAIQEFLSNKNVATEKCFSYAVDLSDLPMLEIVGHPVIVKGNPELERIAKQRSWEILDTSP